MDEFSTAVGPVFASSQVTVTRPELALSKALLDPVPGPAKIDQAVTFRINITNTGSTDVNTMPLSDDYSAACLAYDSATPAADSADGGTALWNDLGALGVGGSSSVVVTFTVVGPCSPALNTARVDFAEDVNGDPVPAVSASASITSANVQLRRRMRRAAARRS